MLLCVNSRGCFRLVLLINQAFIIILEKLFIMLRMASRVKTFLVLLCITGACIVCFHQVLVPVTSSKIESNIRKVPRTGQNDSGFERAKVMVDTIKKSNQRNTVIEEADIDKDQTMKNPSSSDSDQNQDVRSPDEIHDNRSKIRSSVTVTTEKSVSESYVSVIDNGSLIYEDVTDNVTSEQRETAEDLGEYMVSEVAAGSTVMSPYDLEEEHELRIKHLHKQCGEIRNLKTSLIGRANITDFFFSSKYKFAYCKVPKSGSTFWMQLFMVLSRGDRYAKLMSHWTRAQVHDRTRRYHANPFKILKERLNTIVVARNPFSRLYSAYTDKVFMPLFWHQFSSMKGVQVLEPIFVNQTVRVYNASSHKRLENLKEQHDKMLQKRQNQLPYMYQRPNRLLDKPSEQILRERYNRRHLLAVSYKNSSINVRNFTRIIQTKTVSVKVIPICANHATFEDFLRFIISEAKGRKALEPHWAPITNLCRPCRFNTYRIVKQESFAADVEHSLKSFGIELSDYTDLKASLTERRAELSIPGIIGVIMDRAASPEIQKCITPKEIAERIWKSFQIQGFISDKIAIPTSELPEDIKQLKFKLTSLALDAVKRSGFTREQQKAQRRKHLLEAYKSVSADVIRDVQSIYQLDFSLFNYSNIPPHL